MSGDGFLSRWAKRKALVRQGVDVEADAPHPGPLPRGAREQALRGSGPDAPAGQALDPQADQRLRLPAYRNAPAPSPPGAESQALAPLPLGAEAGALASSLHKAKSEAPAPTSPGAESEALAPTFPNAASEALAPSPLWGEGRGEGRGPLPPPAAPPKTLEDVATLTPDADFTPFLSPQVEAHVQRAALKKLFTDPHFKLMDGLDTYIDDYSKPDPIPESMLRRMAQSKALGLFDDVEEDSSHPQDDPAPATVPSAAAALSNTSSPPDPNAQAAPAHPDPEASPDGAASAELTQSASAPHAVPRHEDPDLRLQQDDAAGCGGPREGAAG